MSARWRWRNLSLQTQLMSAFAAFCLLTTGLFSLYALAFAYTVEDQFFAAMLEEQAQRHQQYFARHGRWPQFENPNVRMYFQSADLPEEVRTLLALEPRRSEFAGAQGRHYHVQRMKLSDGAQAWLVAEVSQKLVFRRMRGTVLEILLFSILGALLTGLVLAWYLARTTALPISRLSAVLATLKPNQLPPKLPHDQSLSEVGVLTRGLNDLVQRVREFIEREQAFTRDVSHELRTPLTVISCTAEQLIALPELSESVQGQLQLILRGSAQLQQTVHTLLTIARDEKRSGSGARSRVLPVLEQVVLEQASLLGEKAVELDLRVDASQQAELSEAVLHIVLSNLLGNAFAHCDSPSTIEVLVRDQRLCIRNQSGVELDPQLFAEFHKQSGSTGFGLGLSIVQRLSDRFSLALQLERQQRWVEASFDLRAGAVV